MNNTEPKKTTIKKVDIDPRLVPLVEEYRGTLFRMTFSDAVNNALALGLVQLGHKPQITPVYPQSA